jgi:hypothetical protein
MRESDLRMAAGKWDSDNGIISRKLLIFRISLQDKMQQSTFVLKPGGYTDEKQKDIFLISGKKSDGTRREVIYVHIENVIFAPTPNFPSFFTVYLQYVKGSVDSKCTYFKKLTFCQSTTKNIQISFLSKTKF